MKACAIHLVPAKPDAEFVEARQHLHPAFGGDVGILAAPDNQEFATNVFGALERVVVHARGERAFMDVGGVEASGGLHIRVHGSPESEMAADADAKCAESAGAVRTAGKMVEHGASVGVIRAKRFGRLQFVAAVRSGLIVVKDGPGRLVLVIDLGHGDDIALPRQHRCGTTYGCGDLEYFGVKHDSRVAARRAWTNDVCSHDPCGSFQVNMLAIDDDHAAFDFRSLDPNRR